MRICIIPSYIGEWSMVVWFFEQCIKPCFHDFWDYHPYILQHLNGIFLHLYIYIHICTVADRCHANFQFSISNFHSHSHSHSHFCFRFPLLISIPAIPVSFHSSFDGHARARWQYSTRWRMRTFTRHYFRSTLYKSVERNYIGANCLLTSNSYCLDCIS